MIAGTIIILAAVEGIPTVAHFAWSTLSADSRQAIRDPLTGLLNRRGADVSVEPLWSAAADDGHAVAVLVVDVDDFKRINDHHGHDEGDRTLRRIADALDTAVRDGVLARTGGEEFTAYLAGSGVRTVLPALRTADTLMYEAKQRGGGRALTADVDD